MGSRDLSGDDEKVIFQFKRNSSLLQFFPPHVCLIDVR